MVNTSSFQQPNKDTEILSILGTPSYSLALNVVNSFGCFESPIGPTFRVLSSCLSSGLGIMKYINIAASATRS